MSKSQKKKLRRKSKVAAKVEEQNFKGMSLVKVVTDFDKDQDEEVEQESFGELEGL